jgi:hypothetical protein
VGGWGKADNKSKLSPAVAGSWAELGKNSWHRGCFFLIDGTKENGWLHLRFLLWNNEEEISANSNIHERISQ